MKKFEITLGLTILFFVILKFFNVVGATTVSALTMGIFSLFYLIFSFALFNNVQNIFSKSAYQGTNTKRIIGSIGLGWVLSTILFGILFKLQLYPGAAVLLTIGLTEIGIILIVVLILYFKNKAVFYSDIIKRITIYGVIGLISLLTPAQTLIDIYYKDNPEYAELYKKVIENPNDLELYNQFEAMKLEMRMKEVRDQMK
ncbi:MAG: hypothetical protein L3J29_07225 [Cyclobacteriaceae bacterium]|nr:hypothetical protein [Cyclobacteriaceae bacterium]